jgi:hypothetical protein
MNAKAGAKIAGAERANSRATRALSKAQDACRRTLGRVKETSCELREKIHAKTFADRAIRP